MEIRFSIVYTITNELLDAIVTTAFEGGINYWCGSAKQMADGVHLDKSNVDANCWYMDHAGKAMYQLYDAETDKPFLREEGFRYRPLTRESLIEGLSKYMRREGHNLVPTLDAGEIDADHADVIVQLACFGELVFG